MKFLNNTLPDVELTYSDVFIVPQKSDIASRFDVDLTTPDNIGTKVPIVIANMNAVAGRRMAETVARRGGLTVLPQDASLDYIKESIKYIKDCNLTYETPVSLKPNETIAKALDLITKRSHNAIVVVDDSNKPVGIFTSKDSQDYDRFTKLSKVMATGVISVNSGQSTKEIFDELNKNRLTIAPVVNESSELIGMATLKGMVRSSIYQPAVGKNSKLLTAVAVGINGNPAQRAFELVESGVDIIVIDTAHGHQVKMLNVIKEVRAELGNEVPIVDGKVATKEATIDLINAGANIVKVGIGPGAMCTTRMMTGVGRPQFSAVYECSEAAKALSGYVWADGGIKHPRDVALALVAGASNVMIGSMFAGTFESAADVQTDTNGNMYKQNYGMASRRAVKGRTEQDDLFSKAKKQLFEEGISTSKIYLQPESPGAEDIIDNIVAGVRSAMTYSGALNIKDFQAKATIGLQSAAGYSEGLPRDTNLS